MILVDTSVWIDHFRVGESALVSLLKDCQVLGHPFVSGELACGNLTNRTLLLNLIGDLPQSPLATQEEVMFFIEHHKLMGRGIGFIDAHLLASTALIGSAQLWTRDKRLANIAKDLKMAVKQ